MYSSLHPIFSLLFFSFASFFASLLALFSSGVSRAFNISFCFFLSSFSLATRTSRPDPELSDDSGELERRLPLSLTALSLPLPLLPSSLSLLLFLCSRLFSPFLSLSLLLLLRLSPSLSRSLFCLSRSGLLFLLLSLSLLPSRESELCWDLPLLPSPDFPARFSVSFRLLLTLESSESELRQTKIDRDTIYYICGSTTAPCEHAKDYVNVKASLCRSKYKFQVCNSLSDVM